MTDINIPILYERGSATVKFSGLGGFLAERYDHLRGMDRYYLLGFFVERGLMLDPPEEFRCYEDLQSEINMSVRAGYQEVVLLGDSFYVYFAGSNSIGRVLLV